MITASKTKRIGFLGVGNIALDHLAAILALGHKAVAGCATTQESPRWREFSSRAQDARFEQDAVALLADPDVDAVVVCLPWNVTECWLPQLLASTKPLLIEKPVALSAAALEQALVASDARPENKVIGFNRRFYKTVQTLRDRLQLGGATSVDITISEAVGRLSSKYGPEILPYILVYSSCHILDAAHNLLGGLNPVKVYGKKATEGGSAFRSLTATLETGQGTPVHLSVLAENPAPVGIRVFFDDGTTWHLSPMERLTAYRGYQVVDPTPEVNIRRYNPKPFLNVVEDAALKPGFLEQMNAFTAGEFGEPFASLTGHLELLRLIESLERP